MKKYLSKVVSAVASLSMVVSAIGVAPAIAATTEYDYVDVSGQVNQALAFAITEATSASTATTTCAMGVITYGAVKSCSYGLRISTNATNGFHAEFRAAGEFTNGSHNFIHVTDGAVSVNNEEYGLAIASSTDGGLTGGVNWTQPTVVASPWNGTDQEVAVTTSTNPTVSYGAPFDANKGGSSPQTSTLTVVTHKAAISLGTPQGTYTQRVWWQVTTSP